MKIKWHSTQYPGVRYRENEQRKHNKKPDRYFVIRYKRAGKLVGESLGWASYGMNAQKANRLRAEIVQNIREGKSPQSLREMRQIEAERKLAQEKEKILKEKEKTTFDQIATEFLKWSKENKKDYKNDLGRYKNHIKKVLGNVRLNDISPLRLEGLKRNIANKGLSPKTIHHCLSLIGSIYRKAVIWNFYSGPIPTDGVKYPKIDNKRLRFLNYEESHTLLEALRDVSIQVYEQALISIYCGLRFSEIAKLIWADVDLDNGIMQVKDSKSGDRQAYITEPVKDAFIRLNEKNSYKPNSLIFPSKNGKRQIHISSTFYRKVKELGFNDGISDSRQRVCFHSLRHTFASLLALQGTSLYEIMELMGHKDIKMTQRYTHLMPSIKKKAVNKLAENFKAHTPDSKKSSVIPLGNKK
jgi:integrase